jgi:hypothetical protein
MPMATWLIQKAAEGDQVAAEARKRISALGTGAKRKDWHALLSARVSGDGMSQGRRGPIGTAERGDVTRVSGLSRNPLRGT